MKRNKRIRIHQSLLGIWKYDRRWKVWGPRQYTAKMHRVWAGAYVCPDWEPECVTCQSAKLWKEVNNTPITFDEFNARVDAALEIAQAEGQAQRIKDSQSDSL